MEKWYNEERERRKTSMGPSQKDPLRALSKQEEQELRRLVNASSERVDVVRRANALVAEQVDKALRRPREKLG
jgi:hypothetical protein